MKRIIYLGVIAIALFLSSCQKDFLETTPTGSVSAKSAFASLDNAKVVLNGIHRYLYSQGDFQDENGEQSMMIRRDMLGEDLCMSAAGNGWWNGVYKWMDHRNNKVTYYPWKFYYAVIANANAIITGLPANLSASSNTAQYKQIMAQALTYRAWAHFNLVQLYAARYDQTKPGQNSQDGVILMVSTETKPQPRATVEAVYTQINADLDQAIALFPATAVGPTQISDLSLPAAKAIKARVALTTGNWQAALDNATGAMAGSSLFNASDFNANGGFPTVFSSYPGPGSEWIWGHQEKSDQNNYFSSFFAYMSWNFSSTNVRSNPKTINSDLYNAMPATDARKAMFSLDGYDINALRGGALVASALVASYESKKFSAASNGDSRGDLAYIRVAEMYLIAAEAQYNLGNITGAQQALFSLVSTRDNAYVLSTNTGAALLNEILTQRRIELWGEGFRFTDLKRLNMSLVRNVTVATDPALPYKTGHIKTSYAGHHNPTLCNMVTVIPGDVQWQWMIPIEEINANPNIKQNN